MRSKYRPRKDSPTIVVPGVVVDNLRIDRIRSVKKIHLYNRRRYGKSVTVRGTFRKRNVCCTNLASDTSGLPVTYALQDRLEEDGLILRTGALRF